MTVRSRKVCVWIALALAGTLFFPFHAGARDKAGNSPAARQASLKKDTAKPAVKGDSQKKVSLRSRRRRRRASYRYRLARLRLQPDRVKEIQQGLIREGYLQGDPNGRWDDRTRAAMLRYQKEHGFPATGLPEAKSLMKLGLGPHPLPPELDPSLAKATSPDAPKGDPATEPPAPPASQETTPPEEK